MEDIVFYIESFALQVQKYFTQAKFTSSLELGNVNQKYALLSLLVTEHKSFAYFFSLGSVMSELVIVYTHTLIGLLKFY